MGREGVLDGMAFGPAISTGPYSLGMHTAQAFKDGIICPSQFWMPHTGRNSEGEENGSKPSLQNRRKKRCWEYQDIRIHPKEKVIWSFIMHPGSVRGERAVETAKPDIYSVSDQGQMTTSEAGF